MSTSTMTWHSPRQVKIQLQYDIIHQLCNEHCLNDVAQELNFTQSL